MVPGFLFNGVRAGIKPSGRADLGLVLCPGGATAAAMLTRNVVRAAPITVSERHLRAGAGAVRAVLVNAGCANAATGADGERRCTATVDALAARLKCPPQQVLVNSTGVIGVQLPDDRIIAAMEGLIDGATADGVQRFAEAIMTTDTHPKVVEMTAKEGRFRIVGVAKGAGMIHPWMSPASGGPPHATMISVIVTDAALDAGTLERHLAAGCERSFHRITIDGDTSTNDAVFALASGAAGPVDEAEFGSLLAEVMRSLALLIARDGEGATKLVTVRAEGAASADDALAAARTVAASLLVRTAIAGGDPNWGRILAALGRSGAVFDPERLTLRADGVELYGDGAPRGVSTEARAAIFSTDRVLIELDLGVGTARDEFHTCDLTEEYVRVNAEYTT